MWSNIFESQQIKANNVQMTTEQAANQNPRYRFR
jgi:hypothetical protein